MSRSLLALAAAAAFAVAAPVAAYADDDAPQPKKIRIKLKKEVVKEDGPREHAAPQGPRSPMPTIERWLRGRLGSAMEGAGPGGAGLDGANPFGGMLKHWFEGGADVPMADLRDALLADGWNADSMQAWMLGQMMRLGAQMPMRSFAWHGQMPGPMSGWGMQGRGMGGPRMHGWGGGQGRGGWARGPRGWRRGPGPMHGFRGGPRWGMGGPGMGGPGMGGGGAGPGAGGGWMRGPHGMPHGAPNGPQPRVHTQQRAFILWHDGTQWQRREIPGGMGGMGMDAPFAGPRGHGPHGQGPQGQGPQGQGPRMQGPAPQPPVPPMPPRRGRQARPRGGMQIEGFDARGLEQLKKYLEGMRAGGDGAHGGIHIEGMDVEKALEMLKQLGIPLDGAQPKARDVVVEEIIEEVEIHEDGDAPKGGEKKLRPAPKAGR